jgi:ubiquinone/menaquinone biosynthesis C-methylase UbiE
MLSPLLDIDDRVNYWSFGYLPIGSIRDTGRKLFGHGNLLKRLQAKDIMKALNIQPEDLLLDFGCGNGYMTVEMAKLAKKAYGIDIVDYIKTIQIPESLKGRLEFIKTSGTTLPFQDNFFDKILASEVLPMIPDPMEFLFEIRRILKPQGRLVIVNGGGHPTIRKAFNKSSLLLKMLKKIFPERMPSSYEEYCTILQHSFNTAQRGFLTEENLQDLLSKSGFGTKRVEYTPGYFAGAFISWSQFLLYLRNGKTISQRGFFLKYIMLTLLRIFEKKKYSGGILCVAEKR